MQLVMYLGNDFIAAVNVNCKQIAEPGYLGKIKRLMLNEFHSLLEEAPVKPEFLLVNLSTTPGQSN